MSERMTVKEYLGQAYRLDQRIDSKIEQVSALHSLATKATSTLSDVPPSGTRNVHRMEDIIVKIISMENDINSDIDALVDLKEDIRQLLKKVANLEYQTILELRYLNYKFWEQIAVDMGYSIHHLYKLHNRALGAAAVFYEMDTK